ncbi:MAG: ABC transporter permease [Xanthobacteraceae bacterium]
MSDTISLPQRASARRSPFADLGPILAVTLALLVLWYVAAILMNGPLVRAAFEREEVSYGINDVIAGSLSAERPLLPAPHQILWNAVETVAGYPPNSPRSLLYHSWVTVSAAALGFAIGALFGILLAVLMVHVRALEKSLLPWVICSQMVPILAVAPIVIVVLGSLGLRGLLPKAIISAYLCFFPITIGVVKGLSSPDVIHRDLMRTWSATPWQIFWKLRWPSSVPFLFASLKVAVAISLVGAIVGELPTGAQAGLGARMLTGSYYGQTVQIWAALLAAALAASLLIALIDVANRIVARRMGLQS